MAEIPEPTNTTAKAIDEYHKIFSNGKPRAHLGCSLLGHPCDRWLWLSFRWAVVETFQGRILRLFRRGQNEEAVIVEDLKAIGVDIHDTEGEQSRVDFGNHVSGSLDGIIESGVPEAPKARHIAEFKTHSEKSFKELCGKGVEKAKFQHFVQMQVYMHGTGIQRALYVAVNKNTDELYTERVRYDQELAEKYIKRGHWIVEQDRMPEPLSSDPSWYQCRYCPAHEFCHKSNITKEVNCRTCAHATAKPDSTFHCALHDDTIPTDFQYAGCDSHVLHPDLVPWQLDRDKSTEQSACYTVAGEAILNGSDGMKSDDLLVHEEIPF